MANTRQMKLGFSIGSIGYHHAAWRLPEASPDGGLSGVTTSRARYLPRGGRS